MLRSVCRREKVPITVFLLEQGYTAAVARTYCNRCPVKEECADYARRTGSVGVWGGIVFSFKAEVTDISSAPVHDWRPPVKKVVYFEPGQAPGILGDVANFQKPGILG